MFLPFTSKKVLGIDIGTSAIKIIELSKRMGKIKLENYGEISTAALYQEPFMTFEKNILSLSTEEIVKAIKVVIDEAGIKTKKCAFSIPDYSTFFTNFELPFMTKEEIPGAVRIEARRHVPVPLNEVTLDWQVIEEKLLDQKAPRLRILLIAVPNEIISQYRGIASALKLELLALEAEVFGLIRSLISKDEKKVIGLIDIGTRSTTCSIIDKRVLKASHSFDISGNALTEIISKEFSLDYEIAEEAKKRYGISPTTKEGEKIREVLIPVIDMIIRESEKAFNKFYLTEEKEIEKIILAGGTALLPGLVEYFQDYFKKEVEIANPFKKIFYSPELEENLKEIGPSYSIAVGMALKGLE